MEFLLDDFPASLVMNLDETCYCDWMDAKNHKVTFQLITIPTIYVSQWIEIPYAQFCREIEANGQVLRPMVIVHKKTCDIELFEDGYRSDKILYAYKENGFINMQRFER
jgi:hypothetical protein